MSRTVTIIRNLLLVFVFISIGFAIGKNFSSQSLNNSTVKQSALSIKNSVFLNVYYFHSTFRCSTCNKIEKMTKNLLENNFREQVDAQKIIFSDVNFQENEELAGKFGVVASCVVIAIKQNGKILKYRRLDEVWTLIDDPNEFNCYILEIIKKYLKLLSKTPKKGI